MISTLSCLLLFGIIILINGNDNFYNEKSKDLIQKLSSLKVKHGLNFVHIEGTGSLLDKFKQSHPKVHYIEPDDPYYKQVDKPTEMNNEEKFNLLAENNKLKAAPIHDKTQIARMKSLRMCKKLPKVLNCKKKELNSKKIKDSCESEEPVKSDECNCNNCKKKKGKKLYSRTGNNKRHHTVAETAKFLNALETLLAKIGKYNVFLGCVGDNCAGRINRDRYLKDGHNTEGEREFLGCIGDGCGESRDADNVIRRRY